MVDMQILGLPELVGSLDHAAQTTPDQVHDALEASLSLIQADARQNAESSRDTGKLIASINHDISGSGNTLTGTVGPSEPYGIVVEQGRRPGQPPPPAQALAGWASRHGFAGSLYVLARSIGRKGTKAKPFLVPAYDKNKSAITRKFSDLGVKLVQRIAQGR